jgi:hypothetical protein
MSLPDLLVKVPAAQRVAIELLGAGLDDRSDAQGILDRVTELCGVELSDVVKYEPDCFGNAVEREKTAFAIGVAVGLLLRPEILGGAR